MPRFAVQTDTPALRALWSLCFPGEEVFADFFFRELYRPEQTLALYGEQGEALAMVHILPCEVKAYGGVLKAGYLYGVGTHPDFRRRGLARILIDQTFFQLHLQGVPLALLIPQEAWLFDFYAPFGFRPVGRAQLPENDLPVPGGGVAKIAQLDAWYESHFAAVPHVRRSERDWEVLLEELRLSGGRCYAVSGGGYVLRAGDKTLEAAGPAVRSYVGAAMGCVRIVESAAVRAFAVEHAPGLTLPAPMPDEWCPWNRAGDPPGTVPLEDVLFENLYMDLMHN
jgi:predicted N-acetyltransferase YhbS